MSPSNPAPPSVNEKKDRKIMLLSCCIVVGVVLFLLSILKTITLPRDIPAHNTTIYDRSFRGKIISKDNYVLSQSQKTYKAIIRGASLDPNKRDLFVKLFSIYSQIPEKELYKKFKNKEGKERQGNIVLSRTIHTRAAMQLKELAYKLRQMKVFRSIRTKSGMEVLYGLDIIENGETREFPLQDVLSPVLGYVRNKSDGKYTRPEGQKGLEKNYEEHITSKKNGYFRGKRDVGGTIIHDKNSMKIQRVDGLDLHLNIPLSLQRRVELMIDAMKTKVDAQEILVGIMESHTGKVVALASTERYLPSHITTDDISALNPKFAEYPYEAGSVMKPITLAIALDHKVVTPHSLFKTGYYKFQIGKKRFISDDDFIESQDATDIIVHSSNIGISQISWRLSGTEFREGLLKFGVARPSGIDLSRDLPGQLKPLYKLQNNMHRANTSYGYGMTITFAQLFKAYSAFNNDGIAVTPRIVNYLSDFTGEQYTLKPTVGDLKAVSPKTAHQIHNILCEVVKRGTGVKAQYPGLEIGGKTGTAHIAEHGHYIREYHSSFYGFANDKEGHKYTLGVLVIRAKKYHKYFASQSAVPTFKNLVRILVDQGYLKVDEEAKKLTKESLLYPTQKEENIMLPPLLPVKETPPPSTTTHKSVKELFHLKKTVKAPQKKVKHTPKKVSPPTQRSTNKSAHELFEDLF